MHTGRPLPFLLAITIAFFTPGAIGASTVSIPEQADSAGVSEAKSLQSLQQLIRSGQLARAQAILDDRFKNRLKDQLTNRTDDQINRPYQQTDVPWLLARAEVHGLSNDPIAQLAAYDAVLALDSTQPTARRERAFALLKLGAPLLAQQYAEGSPELFTPEELLDFRQYGVGRRIRWGSIEIRDGIGPGRFAATDVALAESRSLQSRLAGAGQTTLAVTQRADFDRLVALLDRVRMPEAIELYEDLQQRGIRLPAYALAAAAGAYLHQRHPEMARDLYLQALQLTREAGGYPNPDWQFALFDAYVEANDPVAARRLIDDLVRDTPPVINQGLKGVELDNEVYTQARVAAARQRLFSDELRQSQSMVDALVASAPFNLDSRLVQADLLAARDQPRLARQAYDAILVDDPANMHAAVGVVETALTLNDLQRAQDYLGVLAESYPESPAVHRAQRTLHAHLRPVLLLNARRGRSSSGQGIRGTSDYSVESSLYSSPVQGSYAATGWRAFAHTFHAAAKFDVDAFDRTRIGLGGEYRADQFNAALLLSQDQLTFSDPGVRVDVSWFPNDIWGISLAADSNSNAIPLEASEAGVEAREVRSAVRYARNESASFEAGLTFLRFSDGNHRTAVNTEWRQRWFSGPEWKLSTRLGAFASANSRLDVVYFNPDQDLSLEVALISEWTPWRRYERAFTHRLELGASHYWQQGFQARLGTAARYEHEWQIDHSRLVQYGIDYTRQAFDGEMDTSWSLFLNLIWRL